MRLFRLIRLLQTHWFYPAICFLLCGVPGWADQQPSSSPTTQEEILELSLEDILNIEITSVSKKAQSLSEAPAAIFVITNDDLRRSGVTNIPDALRMVPGLNVARIDSNKWAVTSRGFNGRFANKLLVLIDGRSVYAPSFSGVYWEVQDTLLEDVERIEVIRGPGATLWGANAVNGVINIITRHAADTQGGLVALGAGSKERGFAGVRYGAVLGEGTYGRIYAKGFRRDEFVHTAGDDANDDWDMLRSGFRVDSRLSGRNALTLQGDVYQGNIDQTIDLATLTPPYSQRVEDEADVSGWNMVARWQHTLSSTSEFTIQAYYDRTDRDEAFAREVRDTFDIDFQHRFAAGEWQDIIWGLGYRYTRDDFTESLIMTIDPDNSSDELLSAFLQDEITLLEDRLWLTLGSKFEHNDYTGFEIQPNARLLWAPHPKHKIWAAVSRAVRTPSRAEYDIRLLNEVIPPSSPDNPSPFPIVLTIVGDSNYDSEELLAYELGYRVVPAKSLSLDVTAFYNDYDNLRNNIADEASFQGTHVVQPLPFDNKWKGEIYGIELAAAWQAADWWRLDIAYSYLRTRIDASNEREDNPQVQVSPRHQVSLRSAMNLRKDLDMDLWLRYVDDVKAINARAASVYEIDSYLTLDARLAWRPIKDLEFSLVGQNLLDDKHPEYIQENFTLPTEIERSIYGKVTWSF
jgi:iron complex outermembrane receptor protein